MAAVNGVTPVKAVGTAILRVLFGLTSVGEHAFCLGHSSCSSMSSRSGSRQPWSSGLWKTIHAFHQDLEEHTKLANGGLRCCSLYLKRGHYQQNRGNSSLINFSWRRRKECYPSHPWSFEDLSQRPVFFNLQRISACQARIADIAAFFCSFSCPLLVILGYKGAVVVDVRLIIQLKVRRRGAQ